MLTRIQISALLAISALIWAVVLLVQKQPLTMALLNPFSAVVTSLVIILWLFDKWLWKWSPLHLLFSGPTILEGTWQGTLRTTWVDQSTGKSPPDKTVYLLITQQWSAIHLRLMTDQGGSISILAREYPANDGLKQILCLYENTPKAENRGQSKNSRHYGGMILQVQGEPAKKLEGHYWTDKNPSTSGYLSFSARSKARHTSFEEASAATYP